MILSVCVNPSIDTVTRMDEFLINEINRTDNIKKVAGGKGNNTARIIKSLGEEVEVLNLIGGYEGQFILDEFNKLNIFCNFVKIKNDNRRCLAILTSNGEITELREAGPFVDNEEYKLLIEKFSKIYNKYELITISGSIPQNMNKNIYYDLVSIANENKIKSLVDAKGEVLEKVLEAKPFMIKINQSELSELVGKDISSEKDLIAALDDLIAKGIQVAIVSIGEKGLLANWQGTVFKVSVPHIKVVSTVGSGDAVLAGLSYGMTNNLGVENTLKLGASMGTAAAMSAATGQYNKSDLEWVRKNVKVNILRQDYNSNNG